MMPPPSEGELRARRPDADPPWRFSLDRRLLWLGCLALFALGLYVALEFRRAPERELPRLSSDPARAASRDPAMDYDEFMSAFGALSRDTAGIAFAKAYLAEPELAEIWGDFKQDKDVTALAQDLKSSGPFHDLLAKQSRAPGFKEFVQRSLTLLPSLSGVLRGGSSSFLLGGSRRSLSDRMLLERANPPSGASTRAFAQNPQRTGRSSALRPQPAYQGARYEAPSGTQDARRFRGATAQTSGPAQASSSGASSTLSDRAAFSGQGPPNQLGAPNRLVDTKLATIANAQSDRMARLLELFPWLGGLSEDERRGLLPLIDQHGLWGACFAQRIYQKCQSACAASGSSCVTVAGWQACLDFQNNNAASCAVLCSQQPGCTPSGAPPPTGAPAPPGAPPPPPDRGDCGECDAREGGPQNSCGTNYGRDECGNECKRKYNNCNSGQECEDGACVSN